jgi:hypothetical protein
LLAEQFGPMVPEHVYDALEAADSPIDYLAKLYPRVNQHKAWFEQLIANLFEPDDDKGGLGGITGDAPTSIERSAT